MLSYYYNNDKYKQELETAENNARELKLGIWQKSQDKCSGCISLAKLNEIDPGEYAILENNCNFDCNLNKWHVKDDASYKKILDFSVPANSNYRIDFLGRIWNDAGDSFYLRDNSGLLVVFYRY